MSRPLLLFALLFIYRSVSGQTLTCTENCRQVALFSMKTSSPVLNNEGQNKLWDFRAVSAISTSTMPTTYMSPTAVPSASLYPTCDLVVQSNSAEAYLINSSTGIGELLLSPNNSKLMLLPLPFSYGNTYTETVSTTVITGADTFVTTYQSTLTAVGTGTLLLPYSSYKNVLSVKLIRIKSQTKNTAPEGSVLTNTSYYYYTPGIRHHLFYTRQLFDTGLNDYGPYTEFVSEQISSIESSQSMNLSTIKFEPNPAHDRVSVHNTQPGDIICLTNTLQQKVMEISAEDSDSTLELGNLSSGLYLISIQTKNGISSQKLFINSR